MNTSSTHTTLEEKTVVTEKYLFREAKPSDAEAVNHLLLAEYGNYPYLLREGSFSTRDASIVCEAGGQVVGFARANHHEDTYEFGGLIIHPGFRGNGIARTLTQVRIELVLRKGGLRASSEPVCNRPDKASQLNIQNFGFFFTGLQVGKYPGVLEERLGQPESTAIAFKNLDGSPVDERRSINVPEGYQKILSEILDRPLMDGRLLDKRMPAPVYHEPYEVRGIRGASSLDIPANWPESAAAIADARSRGFILSGLLLNAGGYDNGVRYDFVRLQRISAPIDFGRVYVIPALSALHAHICDELARRTII